MNSAKKKKKKKKKNLQRCSDKISLEHTVTAVGRGGRSLTPLSPSPTSSMSVIKR